MDRRRFLEGLSIGGGVAVLAGATWAHRSYTRSRLRHELLEETRPVLSEKARAEITSVPAHARREIRNWFHGRALNAEPFAEEVCSDAYREKLHACSTEDEQEELLLTTFFGRVATHAEIVNRVHLLAEEAGAELDAHWTESCRTIASRWNLYLSDYGPTLDPAEFVNHLDRLVMQHVDEAMESTRASTGHPTLGEALTGVGEAALLVLPQVSLQSTLAGPMGWILVPAFVLTALAPVFRYIAGLLSDPRGDIQRVVSSRVSLLGNRIASEFESELRARLHDLHDWQEQSLHEAAQEFVESATSWS